MEHKHRIRGRRILGASAFALLLVASTYTVPDSWLSSFTGLFGVSNTETGAFTERAAALDEALDKASESAVVAEALDLDELAPHVAVRRALRAGPMTSEEVRHATRILTHTLAEMDRAKSEEEKARIWQRVHKRLLDACPRLNEARLSDELEVFLGQLTRARPRPASGGVATDADCATCHSQTAPLPSGRVFDVVGLYPHMGHLPAFEGGENIPLLVESLELATLPQQEEGLECLTCHVPHDARGFGIDTPLRVENQGLWANIIPSERGIFHVQVKTKNHEAAHRVPAGYPAAAYVVGVDAFEGEQRLSLRYGSRLPEHLRTERREAGVPFARHMVNERGAVTTDLSKVVDLQFDSRLTPGRFAENHFVFDRRGESPARVVVTLWHLPDYATWKGAEPIRRAEEREPDKL